MWCGRVAPALKTLGIGLRDGLLMSSEYRSDVECRCVSCDDMIRRGDWVCELAGELFHAECA
mgnify:CR=1 FL=1